MNKYQKIIDYDKNEAHYFCNEYGIAMEISKDIIIDDLQERINKAYNKIENMFDRGEEETLIDDLLELEKILQGEDNGNN